MSVRKRSWVTRAGETREAWIARYTDGSGVRRVATFARKKDADAYDAEVRTAVRAGTHTAASISLSVAEAAENWLTFVELENRERSTVAQYRQHVKLHIIPRIGLEKLATLTMPRIEAFRDDLLAGLSRALAKKVLTSLKSILKDAQRRGNVAQNVARDVRIGVDKRSKRKLRVGTDIPTPQEIGRILQAATGKWRPILVTLIFTGLRSSELRGLRWPDIDLKHGLHPCPPARRPIQCDRQSEIGGGRAHGSARPLRAQHAARMETGLPHERARARVPHQSRAHHPAREHRAIRLGADAGRRRGRECSR